MHAIVTDHAFKRCKERAGWNETAAQRMADLALQDGLKHAEARGKLKRYFDALYLAQRSANNVRIYGRHVFVFFDRLLITLMHLDHEHVRAVEKLTQRKEMKP
jgi:hypothetical protein